VRRSSRITSEHLANDIVIIKGSRTYHYIFSEAFRGRDLVLLSAVAQRAISADENQDRSNSDLKVVIVVSSEVMFASIVLSTYISD
jgi:hypothetical protein